MTKPQLQQLTEDRYLDWVKNLDLTFAFDYNPDEDTLHDLLEMDRTFGHWVDGRFVSTVSAFPLHLTVPGGVVPCGGTSVITVSPTHRRQGLLNEMMQHHLDDIRDREEPIAALWASEPEIYGRYGYGSASISATIKVSHPYPPLAPGIAGPASVRLIDNDEAMRLIPPFHDRFRKDQPGMFERWPEWWNKRIFNDPPGRRNGYTANRWVVAGDGDGLNGYARYRVKADWGEDGYGRGEVAVLELFADSAGGWVGLWSYLLNQDLMRTFVARLRSPDDPILDILAGSRRARPTTSDGIWVRIMDVVKALEARSYSSDFNGVIEVRDPFGTAGGTFSIDITTEGAEVKPTDAPAEISLDIRDLGAIYLGRPGLARMNRVGRVAGDLDRLRSVDAAFAWETQPWCPEIF
ncbi:MAG TPA: GNAT family N-acetyltransferase [Acidimicrobiia bacterium]